MTTLSLSPTQFGSWHIAVDTLCRMLRQTKNTWSLQPDNYLNISLAFAKVRQQARELLSNYSSSEEHSLKEHVTLVRDTLDPLTNKVQKVLDRVLIIPGTFFNPSTQSPDSPPDPAYVPTERQRELLVMMWRLQIARWAHEHPIIDVCNPSSDIPITDPDHLSNFIRTPVFDVFTLTHIGDFLFNSVTYSSVWDAFTANVNATNSDPQRYELMLAIFKAKFSNGHNKAYLVATLDAYLVLNWESDVSNTLGHLLMQVREECGGAGVGKKPLELLPPPSGITRLESLQER